MSQAQSVNVAASEGPSFLVEGDERNDLMQLHPLTTDTLLIGGTGVQMMYDAVAQAILYRLPGCSFEAPPRHGKTRAILACQEMIRRHYPGVSIFSFSAKAHQASRERSFYADKLEDIWHPAADSHRSSTLRSTLINAVVTSCESKGTPIAVGFVDEVQNHGEQELTYWKDFCNTLALRAPPIHFITVSAGQPELGFVIENLLKEGRRDLVGRFFLQHATLPGIGRLPELEQVLRHFDDAGQMEFPEGSGVCYSQFFFPHAYAGGWRLSAEAPTLWTVMARCIPSNQKIDIGMAALIFILKAFMFANLASDSASFRGSEALWNDALVASPFRALTVVPTGKGK